MREIKFKIWNSAKKEWYKPTYEAHDGKLHDISITMSGECQIRTLECCADMRNNQDYKIMQFTGLRDSKGKEIYEGDIVKFHIFTQVDGGNGGIVEGEKEYIMEIEITPVGLFLKNKDDEKSNHYLSFYGVHEESFEVIGNIYESNPQII
jgi:uncharacterized phage protein (TIGR01671 family)